MEIIMGITSHNLREVAPASPAAVAPEIMDKNNRALVKQFVKMDNASKLPAKTESVTMHML